jgi:hypothetical protein
MISELPTCQLWNSHAAVELVVMFDSTLRLPRSLGEFIPAPMLDLNNLFRKLTLTDSYTLEVALYSTIIIIYARACNKDAGTGI